MLTGLLVFVLLLPLPAAAVSLTPTAGFVEMFNVQGVSPGPVTGFTTFQLEGSDGAGTTFAASAPAIDAHINFFEGEGNRLVIGPNTGFFFEVAFAGQAGNLQINDVLHTRMTIDGTLSGLSLAPSEVGVPGNSFTPLLNMNLCFDSGCHTVSGRGLGTITYADNGNNTFRVTNLGVNYGPLSFAPVVPEPSSWLLFGTGLASLLVWRWRRCRNTDSAAGLRA